MTSGARPRQDCQVSRRPAPPRGGPAWHPALRRAASLAPLLALGLVCAAAADDFNPSEVVVPPGQQPSTEGTATPGEAPRHALSEAMPEVYGEGEEAGLEGDVENWQDRRRWHYGTQYLFPLTRGMEDAGITGWVRYPVGVCTVVFDTLYLPFGAVAGLFGS